MIEGAIIGGSHGDALGQSAYLTDKCDTQRAT